MTTISVSHAATLLGGKAHGNSVHCPGIGHSRKDRSLEVIFDEKAQDGFIVKCWASGDDWRAAREHVKRLLSIQPDKGPASVRPERAANPSSDDKMKLAGKVFAEGQSLNGSLSLRYLQARRCEPPGKIAALRHHPACLFKGKGKLPALLCRFTTIDGDEPRGILRIALLPDGSDRYREERDGWDGKWMLGPVAGCAIKLSADEVVTDGLGLCEGLETGLAILATGWAPIWVCGSAGAVAAFPVLEGIECLTIFADHDEKKDGEKAAAEVIGRWAKAGREAVAWVPNRTGDFNDLEVLHARR